MTDCCSTRSICSALACEEVAAVLRTTHCVRQSRALFLAVLPGKMDVGCCVHGALGSNLLLHHGAKHVQQYLLAVLLEKTVTLGYLQFSCMSYPTTTKPLAHPTPCAWS